MQEPPWMRPDFDLGTLLSGEGGADYRARLESALGDLARQFELRRRTVRDRGVADRLAGLIDACSTAATVVGAAHDAAQDSHSA